MQPFEQYLQTYHVEPRDLSFAAGVRYFTVWNALKGLPIRADQAKKIRTGVQNMTGVAYEGSLVTLPEQPVDELPTLHFKRIKHHYK